MYRLAKSKYANLSGAGAAARPGRWNAPGTEAIYTSLEAGVTLLERLVHTDKASVPRNLSLMQIRLSGNWIESGRYSVQDSQTEATFAIFPSLAFAKSFATEGPGLPFAIALPSVIVPVWNVVLFPQRFGFGTHVSLGEVEPFELDQRLFP